MLSSQSLNQLKITVAGCGDMGLPMAKALIASGYRVGGFDIKEKSEFGDFAAQMIEDSTLVKNETDVLISVVRDEKQTDALLFDEQAIFRSVSHPSYLVISSTLSPNYIADLATRLPQTVQLIDAPMSGAVMAAEKASLTFMIGGNAAAKQKLKPLFEAMGETLFDMGQLGAGMTAKVMNNYITAAAAVATRQTLDRAQELGVEPAKLLEVIHASSGQNWFASNFEEIYWSAQNYEPSNTMGILEKDVRSSLAPFEGRQSELDAAILNHLKNL
ncbi:NAD(P)-dependent oxidoreductase [Alphaproteobacteria bacterium]|jgi:3-hydroxyisobutyrate dehydrogenase-like beta-hydroxyacid dehydrogenase|nr:NAD(P)-dependent oxidoreductase [Alphaproteobacteria bacterium]